MIKATLDDWAQLYRHAIRLKNLRPWESLSFLDTISIKMPDRDEMYYVSIDENPELISIHILRDSSAYARFIKPFLKPDYSHEEVFNDICSVDIFTMCIGNRENVPKNQYNLIKELGLSFRGRMNWVFFLSKRKCYAPADPDKIEVMLLTECIEQICHAIEDYNTNKIDVRFDDGFALCRYYDDDEKRWMTIEKQVPIVNAQSDYYKYENELQIQRIKKIPYSGASFDIDITFVESKIKDTQFERDPVVRLLILSNRNSGEILETRIILPNDDLAEMTFDAVFSAIGKVGRPGKIHYTKDICEELLDDFCSKTGIHLFKEGRLPSIDHFLFSMMFD